VDHFVEFSNHTPVHASCEVVLIMFTPSPYRGLVRYVWFTNHYNSISVVEIVGPKLQMD